ncbi:MAG: transcriptional regulator [Anaerolineae bacterium]
MTTYTSRDNFFRAHSRAIRQDLVARLSGKSNDLLPFEVLVDVLQAYEQTPRPNTEMVPLDRIVGSVGRYKDFNRDFLPRSAALAERWTRVEEAMDSLEGVPPVELYKLGDVYFVADGNHRVSVARANGLDAIEAHVTEIPVPPGLDLTPGDSLDQAIMKAERARFLAETQLDRHFTPLDIYFTRPGGFKQLLDHVRIHQRLLAKERPDGPPVTLPQAALDWYLTVYRPIIETIRRRQLLRRFPGRTAADLYVWIWGYIMEIYRTMGERVPLEEAAAMLELRADSPFMQTVQGLMQKLHNFSFLFTEQPPAPDWLTQTFEWDDGSLDELSRITTASPDDRNTDPHPVDPSRDQ